MVDFRAAWQQRNRPSGVDSHSLTTSVTGRYPRVAGSGNAVAIDDQSGVHSALSMDSEKRLAGFRSGAASTLRLLLAPLGRRAATFHCRLRGEDRLRHGLVILLPGIDGCTTVCDNIARGILAAGCSAAVEIHDWRSFRGWNPLHLATAHRNRRKARGICRRIVDYCSKYPDRPVHLVGHSAGAGIALLMLRELPAGVRIDTTVLLAAAVSRDFDVHSVASVTSGGIWNFWSRGDLPALGLGTMIFGTIDRRHSAAAGALGFTGEQASSSRGGSHLHQIGYQYAMAKCWHFGGHFGCTNAAFVARYVAPILTRQVESVGELLRSG